MGLLLTRVDGQRVSEEVVDLVNRPVEEAHLMVVPVRRWVVISKCVSSR